MQGVGDGLYKTYSTQFAVKRHSMAQGQCRLTLGPVHGIGQGYFYLNGPICEGVSHCFCRSRLVGYLAKS
jgi:hypothetical protein